MNPRKTNRRIIALSLLMIIGTMIAVIIFACPQAKATPMVEVCDKIDRELLAGGSYTGYLIEAAMFNVAFGLNTEMQVKNIVDSVVAYCPEHLPGMYVASKTLAGR